MDPNDGGCVSSSELPEVADALKAVRDCLSKLEALSLGTRPDGQARAAIDEAVNHVALAETLLSSDGWQMQALGG